jgi:hypothetical protein
MSTIKQKNEIIFSETREINFNLIYANEYLI